MSHEGSMNPLQWHWADWHFEIKWGSLLDPTPLLNTITSMWRALPTLIGGDETEGRLKAAAAAHDGLAVSLDKVFDALDGRAQGQHAGYLDKIVKEWKGKAADDFRKVWGLVLRQDNRVALKKSCTEIADLLRMVAESAAHTRQAIIELLKTAIIWYAAFIALRWAAGVWGGWLAAGAAYMRTTKIVLLVAQVLTRFASLLRICAGALKILPVVGRLKWVAKLGTATRTATAMTKTELAVAKFKKYSAFADKFAASSFNAYAKTSGSVYAGVIGTQMVAQGISGHSLFNLAPLTFTQAARITTGAMVVATFAPMGGFFGKGILQGGTAASWAATLTKTGAAVGESGMAFGGFVGMRNWAYEQVKLKLPGARVAGKPGNFHKQFWGGIPTSLFRVWRPLQTNHDFGELPQSDVPVASGHATPPSRVGTEKVGYWPVNNGSLYDIAEKVYGDPNRWREIYNANRDIIGDDPRSLVPGQVLRIPLDE
ncbi:LysM peptidoglycan-binding domain-containing protein [Nonomuraea guangzhouensis]|uniref:LysM domain-containing protein n=1 Tax=Nonomuraea guangzhouensis TaxID=1291555 RepID=A0ABW4GI77_9ACTN|nr:LysM peptidoglycan-binding domain-containing protein [Nonomuraea guangzhouensis]